MLTVEVVLEVVEVVVVSGVEVVVVVVSGICPLREHRIEMVAIIQAM